MAAAALLGARCLAARLPCGRVSVAGGRAARALISTSSVEVNGRSYCLPEAGSAAVVAVCLDGSDEEYLDAAKKHACAPWLSQRWGSIDKFSHALVSSAMPSFTNPNNVSIVTGVAPAVHGICGNYFYDESRDEEIMMNDPKFMRSDTILAKMSEGGVRVVVITAKDKLCKLLCHGLTGNSFGFSVERLSEKNPATLALLNRQSLQLKDILDDPGRGVPGIYDADISVACLNIAARLIERDAAMGSSGPTVFYVSTTDYVQHKYRPDEPQALEFYSKIDAALARLDSAGAVLGVTADHGMNDKVRFDGSPQVLMLEPLLEKVLGGKGQVRVILPITDPYVVHHGALGSFATVYLRGDRSPKRVQAAMAAVRSHAGVYTVMARAEAARSLQLPEDRIGDFVVVGDESTVLGRSESYHDLRQVPRLRSHGGFGEMTVPMLFNRKLTSPDRSRLLTSGKARNYHLFDFLCNGFLPEETAVHARSPVES